MRVNSITTDEMTVLTGTLKDTEVNKIIPYKGRNVYSELKKNSQW